MRNGAKEVVGSVVLLHDVTELRGLARQMSYQATHDALTGLINRREFERRLEEAIAALADDAPATPARGRHRAPRRWWGWPTTAISTTLLLAQTTAQALGQALSQTGLPL